VLARAGFTVRATRRATGTTATGAPRQRAPRVSLDTIKAAAVRLPKQFTLNDLAEKAGGGSQGTLRKALDDLVAEGKVRRLGPVPNYRGRGRAPIQYEQG
jgi:inhibitor of KinA sporulation pathway (predicted exonuclease)